jgi:hypothetical protein
MIENLTGNYTASASVVDGTLILSLPDAISPVVWRLELGQAKASALEVREDENGTFTLTLKTPRGDINTIASFVSRGRAVAALMEVGRAMQQAHGQIYPAANDSEPYNPALLPVPTLKRKRAQPQASKGGWGALVAILLIITLGYFLLNMGPNTIRSGSSSITASTATASGVPVSADDFFKNNTAP